MRVEELLTSVLIVVLQDRPIFLRRLLHPNVSEFETLEVVYSLCLLSQATLRDPYSLPSMLVLIWRVRLLDTFLDPPDARCSPPPQLEIFGGRAPDGGLL